MTGNKGMTHYSLEIKTEVVRLRIEEGLTYPQIMDKLKLRNGSMPGVWVSRYKKYGEAGLKPGRLGEPRKIRSEAERVAQLEMENALLKKFRTELRKVTPVRRDIGSLNTTEKFTK